MITNASLLPLFLGISTLLFLPSCSPASKHSLKKSLKQTEKEFQDHVGFVLYDPVAEKKIVEYNSSQYFTPASNTKIFTLFTSLQVLGDSVPALRYVEYGDTLFIWGTGDPSFLYPDVFNNGRTYNFLQRSSAIYYSSSNFHTTHFGPGWSWEDYTFAFSAERSAFPIYGNLFYISPDITDKIMTTPRLFGPLIGIGDSVAALSSFRRFYDSNQTTYYPGLRPLTKPWKIPFRVDTTLTASLLSDTIKLPVKVAHLPLPKDAETFYSVPVDSLYKV